MILATDDEIDRAICSTTPTESFTPAPELLTLCRRAGAAERRRHRIDQIARALVSGYVFAGATAGIVALVLKVWR